MEPTPLPAYHDHLDSPVFCFVSPHGELAGTLWLFDMTDEFSNEISELGPGAKASDEQIVERTRLKVSDDELVSGFIVEAARLMDDLHCSDVLIYDVRGKSDITDYLLIGSGTSDRQIQSVAKEVEVAGKKHKIFKFGTDADGASKWVVVDFVDLIVHLFEPETRAFYDLEMMWGDAPLIEWKRED